MVKCLFAHGFEGRPDGPKAQYLSRVCGFDVIAPSMHRLGWSFLDQVKAVEDVFHAHPSLQWVVGSSLGGFATAVAAARCPGMNVRMILMAPAVGLYRVWADHLGAQGMDRWARTGFHSYSHGGVGETVDLPYSLWTVCRDHAAVQLCHPTVIIHGIHDDVIPVEDSEALVARSTPFAQLIRVNDGHRLTESLERISDALNRLS